MCAIGNAASGLEARGAKFTVESLAKQVRQEWVEDGLPYRSASWHMWRDHRVFVPFATIQNWVEATGKKS